MEPVIEKQIKRETILTWDWLKIHVDDVAFPGMEQTSARIVLEHPGAACLLAITDDEQVVLVKQYRYAAERSLYEIPAGKNDGWSKGFAETAARELAEETPYTATNIELIYKFYAAPGYTDEMLALYKATGLQKNSTLSTDVDEFLSVELFTKDQCKKMLQDGTICDAKTIIALQYWLHDNE